MDPEPPGAELPPRRLATVARMPVTFALALLCVGAWAAAAATGDTGSARHLVASGALERGRVWAGEPWRLLTAPFLHVGVAHLLWNVAGALTSCGPVERALGSRRFLAVYLASALGGSALSLLAQDAVSAGASGALFGVIGAILVLRWRTVGGWRPFLSDPQTRALLSALAVWNLAGVGLALGGIRMDHWAHVGGFASGVLATGAITSPRRVPLGAAVAGLLLATACAAAWPRPELSAVGAWELETALSLALQREDRPAAEALAARGLRGGLDTETFRYARARLLLLQDDPPAALALLRPLSRVGDRRVAEAARAATAYAAATLAIRRLEAEGPARDPAGLRALFGEACAAGHEPSCEVLRGDAAARARP
jgi:membrane associated rhomboid family serine protease